MPDWIFTNGHLGWPLFIGLAYGGLGVLVADYVWRRVTMPARSLLAVVLTVWLLGLLILVVSF